MALNVEYGQIGQRTDSSAILVTSYLFSIRIYVENTCSVATLKLNTCRAIQLPGTTMTPLWTQPKRFWHHDVEGTLCIDMIQRKFITSLMTMDLHVCFDEVGLLSHASHDF